MPRIWSGSFKTRWWPPGTAAPGAWPKPWLTPTTARDAWARDGVHKWIAYRRSDDVLVGRGGLSRLRPDAPTTAPITALTGGTRWWRGRLELGWALFSQFHGQGYATEIGAAGLRFAGAALGADSVISFTERHNIASRRVMERLDMAQVGEIRTRGLVEGRVGEADDAPFSVYLKHVVGSFDP